MNLIYGKITKRFRCALCVAVLLSALPLATQAAFHGFGASMDGLQEVPPVATPGTGLGFFVFDDVSKVLTWDITFGSLMGSIFVGAGAGAHIHMGAAGATGLPVIFLDASNPGTIMSGEGLSAGRFIGSDTLSPALEAALFASGLYVNFHTPFSPSGEIRGQILPAVLVPVPAAAWMLGSALFTLVGVRRLA